MNDTQPELIYDVVIIGSGPAGSTAGIYTARANLSTLVLDKGLTTGALGITSKIANYLGVMGEVRGSSCSRPSTLKPRALAHATSTIKLLARTSRAALRWSTATLAFILSVPSSSPPAHWAATT
jgi:choline dehydrogenase-like flavoprotein